MRRSGYSGVTLSEYTIILGLVALLCVWALSMLGHSTSNLLSSASKGQNSGDMAKLVNLDFSSGGGGSGSGSHASGGSSGGSTPSGNGLNLVESTSGGVNVSSAEGSQIIIPGAPPSLNESMTTAKTFEQMADRASDNPELAGIYRDLADKAYFLAVAQASYEVSGTGNNNKAVNDLSRLIGAIPVDPTTKIMTSLKGIDNGVAALGVGRAALLNNPDINPQDKQTALLLLDATISQSNQQYGNTMLQNPDYKSAISITPPPSDSAEMTEIRNLATTLSVDSPAVKTSVDAGVNLDALAK